MSETVYASSDPAVLAEFAKWQDQHQDWKDRAFELTAEFDPDRPRRMVEIAGTVYVSFDCDPTESDRRKWEAGPQWRPVKLSEYHLALESQEPEVEACAGVSR